MTQGGQRGKVVEGWVLDELLSLLKQLRCALVAVKIASLFEPEFLPALRPSFSSVARAHLQRNSLKIIRIY